MFFSNKRILRIVISLFLVFAVTVFLDFLFEAFRRKEANKTVAEYAYASSNFSLAVQDLYFENPTYKTKTKIQINLIVPYIILNILLSIILRILHLL